MRQSSWVFFFFLGGGGEGTGLVEEDLTPPSGVEGARVEPRKILHFHDFH